MSDPLVPNYKPGVGRLTVDRFDFQSHVDGEKFKHGAGQVTLSPAVIIDGTPTTNVQVALQALADELGPVSVPDATTSIKGIVRLAGDIGGTATSVTVTRLQGKPVSTLVPNNNEVLTWNSGINAWQPSVALNAFSASGDLGGTNILQKVLKLTGTEYNPSVGFVVNASNSVIDFVLGVTPLYAQENATSNHGVNTTIRAQSTTGFNKNGGATVIAGGAPGALGLKGGVKLQFTTSVPAGYPTTSLSGITFDNMVQLSEPAAGRRVLSLCHSSDLNTTDMPANTGDMVMYVRNAVTAPSTGNPSNGVIVYSSSDKLWIKQPDGNNFTVGTMTAPSVVTDDGLVTYDGITGKLVKNPAGGWTISPSGLLSSATSAIIAHSVTAFVGVCQGKEIVGSHSFGDTQPSCRMINAGTNPGSTFWRAGDRDPEGVVSGSPSDFYVRTDGVTSMFYLKKSASFSTAGWKEVFVGSAPNPTVWGDAGQQTYTSRNYIQSTISVAATAFTFDLPDNTATKVEVVAVGKDIVSNNSAQYTLKMGYTRHAASAPLAVGTIDVETAATAGAAAWTAPDITVVSNTLNVKTGSAGTSAIQWLIVTTLTMSTSP